MTSVTERKPAHMPALDALRGVAALVVVLHHCAFALLDLNYVHGPAMALAKGLQHLGHPAVILFFVLSGFVLQVRAQHPPTQDYWTYLVRRGFRLLPAMVAGLLLAAIVPIPGAHGLGPWLTGVVDLQRGTAVWMRDALLLMIRPSDAAYDPVLWSLAYELRFSLVFPLLSIGLMRWPRATASIAVVTYAATLLLLLRLGFVEPFLVGQTLTGAALMTLSYLPMFVVGMAMARVIDRLETAHIGMIGSIVLLIVPWIAYVLLKHDGVLSLVSAIYIASTVMRSPVKHVLSHRTLIGLGNLSYSLYLVHFPILLGFIFLSQKGLPLWAVPPCVVIVSLFVAAASYRFVELPFMAWGKRLARIRSTRPIVPAGGRLL